MNENITPYLYYGNPVSVTDGDTMTVSVDLGFKITQEITVRLLGINTAEVPSWIHFEAVTWDDIDLDANPRFQLAKDQIEFVRSWFNTAIERSVDSWALVVDTEKDDTGKYGRMLADFYRRDSDGEWDSQSLADALVDEYGEGVAQVY